MNDELKVQVRGGFSDRRKINPLNTDIQIDSLDKRTRNKLSNLIKNWCDIIRKREYEVSFFENLLNNAYGEFVTDSMKYGFEYDYSKSFEKYICRTILTGDYSEVLTLIEYIAKSVSSIFEEIYKRDPHYFYGQRTNCTDELNDLFKEEFVGYRMVDGEITPITDEVELNVVETSLDIGFEGCRAHIKKGLSLLSNRDNPDYKNSIKESISAVESICQIICKDDKATLGKTLNQLEANGIKLHKSLKEAFSKLYGYASDEGGIRHAEGMFESDVSFEEAKYFLVSCCAFVNYLIAEFTKKNSGGKSNE